MDETRDDDRKKELCKGQRWADICGYRVLRDFETAPPSENAVRQVAYRKWQRSGNSDEHTNWFEARRVLLAQLVWQNPYLRTLILCNIPHRELILTFMRINEAHDDEIAGLLVFGAQRSWQTATKGQWGEAQVVINDTRGTVTTYPKAGFHPTDLMDSD